MSEVELNPAVPDDIVETENLFRKDVITDMNKKYREFQEFINSQPFHMHLFVNAFGYMDTAMLWFKEIMTFAPIKSEEPAQVAQEAERAEPAVVADATAEPVDAA